MKRRRKTSHPEPESQAARRESRWCDRHGYFIDVEACVARSADMPHCRRCLARWKQLSLPL